MGPIYKPALVLAQGWHGHHPSGAGRGKTATERRRTLLSVLVHRFSCYQSGLSLLLRLEHGAFRNEAGGKKTPQRHHQLARQGDNRDPPDPFARVRRALAEPFAQRALRLVPQPQPGQLDRGVAGAAIPGLADPLFTIGVAAAPGTSVQPEIGTDFAAIAEILVERLVDQPARKRRPQRFEPEQQIPPPSHFGRR